MLAPTSLKTGVFVCLFKESTNNILSVYSELDPGGRERDAVESEEHDR